MEAAENSVGDISYVQESFDDAEWSSDDENQPPQTTTKRSKLTKPSDLDTVTEEPSQISSSDIPQSFRAQSSVPSRRSHITSNLSPVSRKQSISFSDDEKSFGKLEDVEEAFKEAAEDCAQRNYLRPPADVTHDSVKARSWEPSMINMSISHDASKIMARTPVTSTPKSNVSSVQRFDAQISAIPSQMSMQNISNVSKVINNESSTFTGTRINQMIKDINPDQSSVEMAKQFLKPDYKTRVPKQSFLGDRTKNVSKIAPHHLQKMKGVDLSSSSSANKAAQLKPKSLLLKPTLAPVIERSTISSRLSSVAEGAEIAIKPEPISHWGFVAVGDEVQSKIYVRNETHDTIEVYPRLYDEKTFKLVSSSIVHLQPYTTHEFGIIFCPKTRQRYRSRVQFIIGGSGNRYSHHLFGYGGIADIKVVPRPFLSYHARDGVYRAKPADPYNFTFELENSGQRTAFVHIVAEGAKNVLISPQSFCLYSKEFNSTDSKAKISVKLPDGHVDDAARMSLGSATSASTFSRNTVFSLKVYFGVERLRQRAAKYSDDIGRHQTFKGLNLTKTPFLLNGSSLSGNDNDPVSQQDVEMLKAQTHVLNIIVGDERMTFSLPCRPVSSQSQRLLDGYYIPECNKDGDSTIISVANNDRTLVKNT